LSTNPVIQGFGGMTKSSALLRTSAAAAMLGAIAWTSPSCFVGPTNSKTSLTQMQGYRFDRMLGSLLSGGDGSLDTSEGYWVGEKGFEKSQRAQGVRYKMGAWGDELKGGIDAPKLLVIPGPFGPIKTRLGEAIAGTGVNDKLRDIKRQLVAEGISDPKKIEENEYWLKRYGHKRWFPKNVNQANGGRGEEGADFGLFRGLAAWSGYDPLNEERGTKWVEPDWGKPWLILKQGTMTALNRQWVTKEQNAKEVSAGKVAGALPPPKN